MWIFLSLPYTIQPGLVEEGQVLAELIANHFWRMS